MSTTLIRLRRMDANVNNLHTVGYFTLPKFRAYVESMASPSIFEVTFIVVDEVMVEKSPYIYQKYSAGHQFLYAYGSKESLYEHAHQNQATNEGDVLIQVLNVFDIHQLIDHVDAKMKKYATKTLPERLGDSLTDEEREEKGCPKTGCYCKYE